MEDQGDESQQPQGSYPRLNAKLLSTGQYTNSIVSMVGHFQPGANPDGTVPFQASDGGIVSISTDVVEMPLIGPDSPPYEIIGQAMSPDNVALFVTRELTKDTDISVYNSMLEVIMNPKFASYFSPVANPHAG